MTQFTTIDPATGEELVRYDMLDAAGVDDALRRADAAYRALRAVPWEERAEALRRIAAAFRERADELALIIAREMGKPVALGRGEAQFVARIFDYYADEAAPLLADAALPSRDGERAYIRMEPIGALLGIMPWNFPYYQVARFAAPNLLLGNVIVLKHAENCAASALAFEEIVASAGLPDGSYVNVFLDHAQVADVIADRRIAGVSLTGSERAGRAVGELAGRHLKKVVLELGGSDAFLVLDGHDLAGAARLAAAARNTNAGQTCTASKRFIVREEHAEEFMEAYRRELAGFVVGSPSADATTMGPLSSERAARELRAQVDDALDKGATVVAGEVVGADGAWFPPLALGGVEPGMRAWEEELFGPVASVYTVVDDDEAIALTNSSDYGLGTIVWCADIPRAEAVAARLEVGMVYINHPERSREDLPFGGVKRSGFGRELGALGIQEFANRKLVFVSPLPWRSGLPVVDDALRPFGRRSGAEATGAQTA